VQIGQQRGAALKHHSYLGAMIKFDKFCRKRSTHKTPTVTTKGHELLNSGENEKIPTNFA